MYIRKVKNGYRVEVERNGARKSAVRTTKAEAREWGLREEAALLAAKDGVYPRRTFAEAMTKYAEEVSVNKKGASFEERRLKAIARDFPHLVSKTLCEVTTPDLAAWRDTRLKQVSPGSVQREVNLISNLFTIARNEWKWCGPSPLTGMRRPGENPPRTKRVDPWREVKPICRWLGYRTGKVETKQQEVALAFLVGLRTAMRASEILSLSDDNTDLKRRVASVAHKTQHITGRPREIPLTTQAARLLGQRKGMGRFFTLTSASLDALFRKARDALLIENLHFHDSRAEALTRLARKVDVMTLARISGHKDLRILMETYYRETASDIAARLT